jgi:hypothetical protein
MCGVPSAEPSMWLGSTRNSFGYIDKIEDINRRVRRAARATRVHVLDMRVCVRRVKIIYILITNV